MIAIVEISLKNFQSHGYTKLELKEGLNAIIGRTDSGKTAIFRAIKWVLYNEPQGDFFVKNGENSVFVELKFNNGYSIKRYKKKNSNGYEITNPDGEISVFEGIGRSVPEEVIEITGVKKINFTQNEGSYINLQEQLDAPFLIAESPSYRAKAIGKLVGADVIDLALSDANTDLRNKKRSQKELENRIENLNAEIKEFDYLSDLKNKLEILNDLNSKIKEKQAILNKLKIADKNLKTLKSEKAKAKFLLKSLKGINLADEKADFLQNYVNKLQKIHYLKIRYENTLKRKIAMQNISFALKNLNEIEKHYEDLEILQRKITQFKNIKDNLDSIQIRKQSYKALLMRLSNLDEASKLLEKLNIKTDILEKLTYDNERQKFLKAKIRSGDIFVKRLAGISDLEEKLKSLSEKIIDIQKLHMLGERFDKIEEAIVFQKNLIQKNQKEIISKSEIYKDILLKSGVCPTCYRKIDEHDAAEILNHIEG